MSAEKKIDREEILAMIPPAALRVKVIDEAGREKYRDITQGFSAIADTDEIVLLQGKPVYMLSTPGRKPKAPPGPPPPLPPASSAVVDQIRTAKSYHIDNDHLVQQITTGLDDEAILHHALSGIATEAASLAFERSENERQGKETSEVSMRRIRALKEICDTFLKRKEMLADKIVDMDSPAFARLFAFMTETFRESMLSGGIPRDQVEVVFQALARRMEDETWGQEARGRMKGT